MAYKDEPLRQTQTILSPNTMYLQGLLGTRSNNNSMAYDIGNRFLTNLDNTAANAVKQYETQYQQAQKQLEDQQKAQQSATKKSDVEKVRESSPLYKVYAAENGLTSNSGSNSKTTSTTSTYTPPATTTLSFDFNTAPYLQQLTNAQTTYNNALNTINNLASQQGTYYNPNAGIFSNARTLADVSYTPNSSVSTYMNNLLSAPQAVANAQANLAKVQSDVGTNPTDKKKKAQLTSAQDAVTDAQAAQTRYQNLLDLALQSELTRPIAQADAISWGQMANAAEQLGNARAQQIYNNAMANEVARMTTMAQHPLANGTAR